MWINLQSTFTKSSVININVAGRTFISHISRSQITFLFKYGKIVVTSNTQCKYLQHNLFWRLSLQGKQHYQISLFKLSVESMSNYISKIVSQYIKPKPIYCTDCINVLELILKAIVLTL